MSTLGTPRRVYCLKRINALKAGDKDMASVWRAKMNEAGSTAYPEGFPSSAELIAAGYLALDDIRGCDAAELRKAGLSGRNATLVLAYLEANP